MNIQTYIVDSFTSEIFKGNPAGVCLLQASLSEKLMHSIASELGLSETAFITPTEQAHEYSIRYFSPQMEIPLCGHATLAASKVIFNLNEQVEKITFHNINDLALPVRKEGIELIMEFPVYGTKADEVSQSMLDALGLDQVSEVLFNEETNILMLVLEASQKLSSIRPDYNALLSSRTGIHGVVLTSLSEHANYDFESRFFWPWSGTNEDPVTGGTHTFLAGYWGKKLAKTKMKAFQCSARSGFMNIELLTNDKMLIRSQAQIVLSGTLFVQ